MNIVEINDMVELIKKTDDKEIREILLEGLRNKLTNQAPTYPIYTPNTQWSYGTQAMPCSLYDQKQSAVA